MTDWRIVNICWMRERTTIWVVEEAGSQAKLFCLLVLL